MKGFIMMVVSVALISLLVVFAASLHESHLEMERALAKPQALDYAAFFFDDTADSLNSLLGPEIALNKTNATTTLKISGLLPVKNSSADLAQYETFLEGRFANQTGALADANFSNMSGGRVSLIINEKYFYSADPASKDMIFSAQNSTNASSYSLVVTTDFARGNYVPFNFSSGGDLAVDIRFSDASGSMVWSGKVYSNQQNRMDMNYSDGSTLSIEIGRTHGSDGSLWMRNTGASPAEVSWSAILPKADSDKRFGYEYNASLSYVQGPIRVARRIGR